MATTTTRLGLDKPDYADAADVAVLNQNFDDIDNAVGMKVVTSTTRPATPWNGQIIYETDTGSTLVWDSAGSAWKQIGGAAVVCTSSTRPASPLSGQIIYETDTDNQLIRVGGAWEPVVNATVVNPLIGAYAVARVADQAARDALFPSPAKFDAVFRKDLGYEETYLTTYNASTNPLGAATAGWYPYPATPRQRVVGSVVSNSTTSGVVKFVLPAVPFRAKLYAHVYIKQSTSHGAGNTGVTFGFGTTSGGVGSWSVNTGFTSFSLHPGGAAVSNSMGVEFVIPVSANITAATTPDFRMTWSVANLTGLSSAGPDAGFFIDYYLEPFRA
jgi:hypothetical protein